MSMSADDLRSHLALVLSGQDEIEELVAAAHVGLFNRFANRLQRKGWTAKKRNMEARVKGWERALLLMRNDKLLGFMGGDTALQLIEARLAFDHRALAKPPTKMCDVNSIAEEVFEVMLRSRDWRFERIKIGKNPAHDQIAEPDLLAFAAVMDFIHGSRDIGTRYGQMGKARASLQKSVGHKGTTKVREAE